MINLDLEIIVFDEGYYAFKDGLTVVDNPYDGVSKKLQVIWEDGWWEAFYA